MKQYLKGDISQWKNQSKVNLAMMKSNTELGKETASSILNMSTSELDKFYVIPKSNRL